MRKVTGLTALGVIGALTLTACSGSVGQESDDGASEGALEQITLQVMSTTMAADPEMSAEQAIGDAFMAEHPNIKIEYIPVSYPDYGTKITTVATSQQVPDVFTNGPELASKIQDIGIAQDLTPLLGDDFIAGFNEKILSESYLDSGELAYAPYYAIPMSLIYRADLFKEADLQVPETWDDFIKVAQALTIDKDGDGNIDQWGFAMVGAANASGGSRFVPVLRSFGAYELTEDGGSWTNTVDTEGGVDAYQLYADLVNKYKVVPPGPLNTAYPDAVNLMASGQTAMFISGSHAIGGIVNSGGEAFADSLASAPIPAGPAGHVSVLGQLGFSISATTKHPEAAAEYIKFFLSKGNQIAFAQATGRIPARTDALESAELDTPRFQGFIDAVQYAYVTPPVPYYLNVQTIAAEGYQEAITGTPADEVAQSVAERINQEVANNG